MQFEQAGKFIINRLRNELPGHFTYHNIAHALDVRNAAEVLAREENVCATDMQLLLTAALYHDSGFLLGVQGHEEESCRIAQTVLPGYSYTANEIDLICGMIRATRMPQSPLSLLEEILADADLDYLGRDDFFDTGDRLFEELTLSGVVMDRAAWNKLQLDFLQNHHYFTASAIKLRQAKKEYNIAQIEAQLLKQTH